MRRCPEARVVATLGEAQDRQPVVAQMLFQNAPAERSELAHRPNRELSKLRLRLFTRGSGEKARQPIQAASAITAASATSNHGWS